MAKQALILIDIQNDYFPQGKWPLDGVEAAADKAVQVLQAFRQAGERSVTWLLDPLQGDACWQVQLPVTLVIRHSTARRHPQQAEQEDLAEQLRRLALLAEQLARK